MFNFLKKIFGGSRKDAIRKLSPEMADLIDRVLQQPVPGTKLLPKEMMERIKPAELLKSMVLCEYCGRPLTCVLKCMYCEKDMQLSPIKEWATAINNLLIFMQTNMDTYYKDIREGYGKFYFALILISTKLEDGEIPDKKTLQDLIYKLNKFYYFGSRKLGFMIKIENSRAEIEFDRNKIKSPKKLLTISPAVLTNILYILDAEKNEKTSNQPIEVLQVKY